MSAEAVVVDFATNKIKQVSTTVAHNTGKLLEEVAIATSEVVLPRNPIVLAGAIGYTLLTAVKPEIAVLNKLYDRLVSAVVEKIGADVRMKYFIKFISVPIAVYATKYILERAVSDAELRNATMAFLTATVFTPNSWMYIYGTLTGKEAPQLVEQKEEKPSKAQTSG